MAKKPLLLDLSYLTDAEGQPRVGTFLYSEVSRNNPERINVYYRALNGWKKKGIFNVPKHALIDAPADIPSRDGIKLLIVGEEGKAPFLNALGKRGFEIIELLEERARKAEMEVASARDSVRQSAKGDRVIIKEIADTKKVIDRPFQLNSLPPTWRRSMSSEQEEG